MNYQLISPDLKERYAEAVRLDKTGETDPGDVLACIAYLLQEDGPEADVTCLLQIVLNSPLWHGQDLDMIEEIWDTGNLESQTVADKLLETYQSLLDKAFINDLKKSKQIR